MTAQEQQVEPATHERHGEQHGHGGPDNHGGHGGQSHRTHKFDPTNVARLLGEERATLLPPEPTLRAAGVARGQTVVDLGCGPGFFTLLAAELVGPGGKVYGVDVQPEMVEACRQRAADAGARQVEVVSSEESHVPLPDGVADRVFVAFVLHETDDPAAFLREARRLLRPGGEVALVEWRKQDGPPGPPKEHRLSLPDIAAAAGPAGLRVIDDGTLNEHHYLVRLAANE